MLQVNGSVTTQEAVLTGSLSGAESLSGYLSKEVKLTGVVSIQPQEEILSGTMVNDECLSGKLNKEASLSGSISMSTSYQLYAGEYDIVPDMSTHVLNTKDKVMNDDVTVVPIPVYSVTNQSGGNTVTIGGLISYG